MDLEQTVVVNEAPSLHLQVETDGSTWYQGRTARQSARLSKIGLGLVGLMLIGASACALLQPSSPSASMPVSANPSGHVPQLAFSPGLPAFRSGGALTRLPMRAPAVTAPRDVKMQFGRKPAKPTAKPAASFGFFGQKSTNTQEKSKGKPSRVPTKKAKPQVRKNEKGENIIDITTILNEDVPRKFVINGGVVAAVAVAVANNKAAKQKPWRERDIAKDAGR